MYGLFVMLDSHEFAGSPEDRVIIGFDTFKEAIEYAVDEAIKLGEIKVSETGYYYLKGDNEIHDLVESKEDIYYQWTDTFNAMEFCHAYELDWKKCNRATLTAVWATLPE